MPEVAENSKEYCGSMRPSVACRPHGSLSSAKISSARSSAASLPLGLARARQQGVGDYETRLAVDEEGERDFKGQWFFFFPFSFLVYDWSDF